jgi:hypothetical protein
MYSELTSTELARSQAAVSYLTSHAKLLRLDAQMVARLSSVQSDLAVEAEDRAEIAALPQRAQRNG